MLTFHQHQTLYFFIYYYPTASWGQPSLACGSLCQLKTWCGCSSSVLFTSIDYEGSHSFYWCSRSVLNCPCAPGGEEQAILKLCTADIEWSCCWGIQSPWTREAFGLLSVGNRERHSPSVCRLTIIYASSPQQCKLMSVHLKHPLQNRGSGAGALNYKNQKFSDEGWLFSA